MASCGAFACQGDDPAAPARAAAAVAPERVTSGSCDQFGMRELRADATAGEHAMGSQRVVVESDGVELSWRSTLGVDAVVVTGSRGSNAYLYRGESRGDQHLVAPTESAGDGHAIERVSFCYDWELDVEVAASASYPRQTRWAISRTPAERSLRLARGQSVQVPFEIAAQVASVTAGPMTVSIAVSLTNPAPVPARITGLEAAVFDSAVEVRCDSPLPLIVTEDQTIVCTIEASSAVPRDGVVRVTTVTSGPVGAASTTIAIRRDSARVDVVDDCVALVDHRGERVGTTCAASAPDRYVYSALVGPYECGHHADSALGIEIDVPCGRGCTRSSDYWRRNATAKPGAPGVHADLAAEYTAAKANLASGASRDGLEPALEAASAVLSTYTPAELAAFDSPAGNALRAQFRSLTRTLRDFNTGKTGPGPCAET